MAKPMPTSNLRYADQAEAAGNQALAKLFRESANVEANEHFDREAWALKLGGTGSANPKDAITGERYENTKMYIHFAQQAEAAGDSKVAAMFRQIAEDEGTLPRRLDENRGIDDLCDASKPTKFALFMTLVTISVPPAL